MDFVTPAGRAEAAEIAARLGRALDEMDGAAKDAYALLVSREALSPAAQPWRDLSALLAAVPYLGDLRKLQEALEVIAGTAAGEHNRSTDGGS